MRVRSLDIDGDWTFGKGQNNYKTDSKAIQQNLSTRLRSFLGDCFFATTEGIDWWNLLGAKSTIPLNLAINATILKTTGVTGIVKSTLTSDNNRKLTLSYEVTTVFSDGQSLSNLISSTQYLLDEGGNILVTEDGKPIQLG